MLGLCNGNRLALCGSTGFLMMFCFNKKGRRCLRVDSLPKRSFLEIIYETWFPCFFLLLNFNIFLNILEHVGIVSWK